MSIIAGMLIGIGCIVYLQIGGVAGALLFAVGLLSIIEYGGLLFTGQAGKLSDGSRRWDELVGIWFGNALGTLIMFIIVMFNLQNLKLIEMAHQIILNRAAVGPIGCVMMAVPCGMLMYAATSKKNHPIYVVMCVAAFILGGFYHCVADMFYTWLGGYTIVDFQWVLYVTIGNLIGCNIIPLFKNISQKYF